MWTCSLVRTNPYPCPPKFPSPLVECFQDDSLLAIFGGQICRQCITTQAGMMEMFKDCQALHSSDLSPNAALRRQQSIYLPRFRVLNLYCLQQQCNLTSGEPCSVNVVPLLIIKYVLCSQRIWYWARSGNPWIILANVFESDKLLQWTMKSSLRHSWHDGGMKAPFVYPGIIPTVFLLQGDCAVPVWKASCSRSNLPLFRSPFEPKCLSQAISLHHLQSAGPDEVGFYR